MTELGPDRVQDDNRKVLLEHPKVSLPTGQKNFYFEGVSETLNKDTQTLDSFTQFQQQKPDFTLDKVINVSKFLNVLVLVL